MQCSFVIERLFKFVDSKYHNRSYICTMINIPSITPKEFLEYRETIPVIDVRTPAEFGIGHVVGAHNVPLFTDDERAEIGTLYKQKSKEQAVLRGLELVGPKMAELTRSSISISKKKTVLVYCWRGGMRSYAFAWMLKMYGLDVYTMQGGYQGYRRYLKHNLAEEAKILVVGGLTGSGKTEILQELEKVGEQVLDLEHLANHKGSVFGQIGEKSQNHNEQFENVLGEYWLNMDLTQNIWVEDEGKSIGKNYIPDELFVQMRKSPVIFVQVPHEERIERLVNMYSHTTKEILITSVEKIKKRLGGQHAKEAIDYIRSGDLHAAANVLLVYYDKAYTHALMSRNANVVSRIDLCNVDLREKAELLKYMSKNLPGN